MRASGPSLHDHAYDHDTAILGACSICGQEVARCEARPLEYTRGHLEHRECKTADLVEARATLRAEGASGYPLLRVEELLIERGELLLDIDTGEELPDGACSPWSIEALSTFRDMVSRADRLGFWLGASGHAALRNGFAFAFARHCPEEVREFLEDYAATHEGLCGCNEFGQCRMCRVRDLSARYDEESGAESEVRR